MSPPARSATSPAVIIGLTITAVLVALVGLATIGVALTLVFGRVGLGLFTVSVAVLAGVAVPALRNRVR